MAQMIPQVARGSSLYSQLASLPWEPLELARWVLFSTGVQVRLLNRERLPDAPFLILANHRSFLDAPLMMVAAGRPVRFACHHYMAQVPVMRQMVNALGCFPLDNPKLRGRRFVRQATDYLRSRESIGLFPEGTRSMVAPVSPTDVNPFHRGFAHLALRAPIDDLAIVPAAIVALEEIQQPTVPFRWLSWFDPSEPMFQQEGRHPAVVYRRVAVAIGQPIHISTDLRDRYQGKGAGSAAKELTAQAEASVQMLLQKGCY